MEPRVLRDELLPEPRERAVLDELFAEPLLLTVEAVALRPVVRELVTGDGVRPEVLVLALAAAVALVVPPVLTTRLELSAEPLVRLTAGDEV